MAKAAIVDVVVQKIQVSAGPPARYNWNLTWTNVSSTGVRQDRVDSYPNKTQAEVWALVRADCLAFETATVTPPPPPPKEMPWVYDPSVATLASAVMAPADYPPGVTG